MTKTKYILLLLALFLCMPVQAAAAADLIQNGGFESTSGELPALWTSDSYLQDQSATVFKLDSGQAHSGNQAAEIRSLQPNDAKWIQTIEVKPKTSYRISGWIKAEGIGDGHTGANLSIIGTLAMSKDVRNTMGEWQQVELIGYTDKDQTELQVAARLGGYGSLNAGTAYFDDVSMEELSEIPAGVNAVPFFQQNSATTGIRHPVYSMLMIFYGLFYFLLFALVYAYIIRRKPAAGDKAPPAAAFFAMIAAAFAIRLILAPVMQGHPIDFNDFAAWANHAYTAGLAHFYSEGMFADYPPGYIYVLYAIGFIQHAFSIGFATAGNIILIKLPAMLTDIAAACLIYILAKRRIGANAGFALSMLYAFNPGVFINSVLWGQIDSVFTLVVLLMLLELTRERLPAASLYFALALLIKPQAVILAPLLLYAMWKRKSWAEAGKSVACSVILFALGVLPFAVGKPPLWIVDHYRSMFASYPYASLNAFNLYALLGANTAPQGHAFLMLTYNAWGYLFTAATVVFTAWLFVKNRASSGYFYLAFLIVLLIFNLKTGMHERYDYVAMALAAVSYILHKDRRLIYLFAAVTFTHFANVAYVFRDSLDQQYFLAAGDGWMRWISLCNLAILIYACGVGVDLFVRKRVLAVQEVKPGGSGPLFTPFANKRGKAKDANAELWTEAEPPSRWKRKEVVLVSVLTLVYAVVALYHLGSLKGPQTYWTPQNYGESFYVDLGETRHVNEMKWFAGVGDGEYKIEQSADGQAWTVAATLEQSYQTVFAWQETPLNIDARYIRLTVEKAQGTLHEIGFFGDDLKQPLTIAHIVPVTVSAGSKGSIEQLFDEQGTIPEHPSYMNSTYFDEIYHARTAYEHLHLMQPYENTHPPLGKILISAGIALFGLDAFGWRIVGTLFGVAMVPIMYAFGKRLFRRSDFAFMTSFLFTFDFMHFAQTRISTIDVYGTFFIILMYYSMYRFYTMNFYRDGLMKTLIPLACSGLFFGLGSASKWIGIYAGAGLAVLFFMALYHRLNEYRKARLLLAAKAEWPEEQRERLQRVVSVFPAYSIKTIAWCALFFVLIPAGIYVASYIPFMLVPGPGHGFADVIRAQKSMYEYHKNLKATHPFSSQWWQWPTMYKPIWYYAGKYMAVGKTSNIISFGNPAVWWTGIFTLLATIWIGIKKRDKLALFILIGFASQYLPWVGVPRLTFIYHYFASIPFVVLTIVYVFKTFHEHVTDKAIYRTVSRTYLFVVLFLFAMFYPILSGMVVDKWYVETFLRWFPQWYFYS